ncbi:MAG: hypothetical protein OES24_16440 [Acidimicrobiia bacterium]|nr:hypothetical protein [Acidimicrobiia bacterium]
MQDPDYGEWAFFGDDGFLVLTVMSAPDGVDAVARNEADHVLQPYGADPTIEPYSVDGRDARLIVPLDDSPAVVEGYRQSAVIAAMTAPDSYLALFGDPANLDGIASTLRWQS